jgi:membrane-associated PAP2 superfamily phosphatase
MPVNSPQFLPTHFIYPLAILIVLSTLINLLDIDKILADYLYHLQGNSWALRDSWITEHVLHRGGRTASLLLVSVVLGLLVASYWLSDLSPHRKPLAYLFTAVAGGSLLVSLCKSLLAVSCPWEFQRYGGSLNYHTVFEQLGLRNGEGCFPAGHASAGYAWVALYFFGLIYSSNLRWVGLVLALVAGITFGFAQQLRGAHFISHDVWTLAVCWFFSLALYLAMFKKIADNKLQLGYV